MWAQKQKGFTIVELLIVIVVIGILAAITIVTFRGIQSRTYDSSLRTDLANASKILALDLVKTGSFPASLAAANEGRGITASNGSSFVYTPNNSSTPPSYTLTISNTKAPNNYQITNTNTTPAVIASTGPAPIITNPSANSTTSTGGCGGGALYYNMLVGSAGTANPSPTIQWQIMTPKNSTTGTWSNISGATTANYTYNNQTLLDGDYVMFRVIYTSNSASTTSPTIQYYLENGC